MDINVDEIFNFDDAVYKNGHLIIYDLFGSRKTSLDLNIKLLERNVKRFYECKNKHQNYSITLDHCHNKYTYYINSEGDVVEIYYNNKLCRVLRKNLMNELDKHFTTNQNWCIIC